MQRAFEKIIERLEEREVRAYTKTDGGATYMAYRNAIEIVNQVASEYGEDKPNAETLIEEMKSYSFERYGNEGMGGQMVVDLDDAIPVLMKALNNDEEVCEWKEDMTLSRSAIGHGKFESLMYVCKWKYCPYCGKKIKVVE